MLLSITSFLSANIIPLITIAIIIIILIILSNKGGGKDDNDDGGDFYGGKNPNKPLDGHGKQLSNIYIGKKSKPRKQPAYV